MQPAGQPGSGKSAAAWCHAEGVPRQRPLTKRTLGGGAVHGTLVGVLCALPQVGGLRPSHRLTEQTEATKAGMGLAAAWLGRSYVSRHRTELHVHVIACQRTPFLGGKQRVQTTEHLHVRARADSHVMASNVYAWDQLCWCLVV